MTLKKFMASLCALILILSAAGCAAPAADPAATEAVNAALEKFMACGSFTVNQLTERTEQLTVDGVVQVYKGSTQLDVSLITGDDARMVSSSFTTIENNGDLLEKTALSYILPEDGGYAEYAFDGAHWYKMSVNDAHALSSVNAGAFIAGFYADRIEFGKGSEDSLEGGKAMRYEGILSGDTLLDMLATSGYLSNVAAMSENQQAKIMENLAKDLSGISVSVWVDQASGYPVRFEVNMTDALKELDKSINKTLGNKEAADWVVTECVISMSVTDFDAVEEIELPAEAASAQIMDIAAAEQQT